MSSKGAFQTAQKANRSKKSMYSQEKLRLQTDMKDAYMNLSYINIMKKLIRLNELSEFLTQSRRYRCLETVDMGKESLELGHSSVTVGALLMRDGAFIKHYCILLEKAGEFNREGRKMEIYRRFHNQIDIRESMFKSYFMKDVLKHMKETTQKGAILKNDIKNSQTPPLSTNKSTQISSSKTHLQKSWPANISKELSGVSSKSLLRKLPWDQAIKRDHFSLLRNPVQIKEMTGTEEAVPEIVGYYRTLKYCARKSEILNFSMKSTLGVYKSYVVRRGAATLMLEQRETSYEGILLRRTTEPDDWLSKGGIERCLRWDDTVEMVVIDE